MNKNIKGINNKKLIRTIIGIFNWKDDRNIIGKNIKKMLLQLQCQLLYL